MKAKNFTLLKRLLLLFTLVGLSSVAFGQRTISGTVTDENGAPLPFANVYVEGTTIGVTTDIDGNYKLKVPEGGKALVVSFTGYGDKKLEIGDSNNMSFTMSEGELLDEVVVIGYGTVKKRDVTGAVTSVSSKDFNQGIITSPEELFQGRAAGVQITSSSGEPGAETNIRIRGTSSVRSDNNPLYVVDGIPLSGSGVTGGVQAGGQDSGFGSSSPRNPLNFLNPNDIESIDILKDASATAIYGSRGANGVVMITTKKGSGAGKVNFNYSLSAGSISKKYDVLSADEYLDAWSQFNPTANIADQDYGATTDWQDEILRTALSNNANLSYSGGIQDGSYLLSVGYQNQEGIVKNSDLRRLTARFNGSKKFLNNRVELSTNLFISDVADNNVPITNNSGFEGDLMAAALKFNPTVPARDADGNPVQISLTEPNPIAILDYTKSITNTLSGLAGFRGTVNITNDLSFTSLVGYDRRIGTRRDAYSGDLQANGIWNGSDENFGTAGRLFLDDGHTESTLWENYLNYNSELSEALNLDVIAGYTYQRFSNKGNTVEMTNFRSTDLDEMLYNYSSISAIETMVTTEEVPREVEYIMGNDTILVPDTISVSTTSVFPSIAPTNSYSTVDELQSYYGRVTFGILDKYILTGTVRMDGSTRFGEGNKYGVFPSFAAKWRISEEGFLPQSVDDLSLRIGYGITGNQEIGHNLYTDRQRYGNWDLDNGGNLNGGNVSQVAFANEDLKWESTSQFNAGIDLVMNSGKFSTTLDFYRKNTNDLLIQLTSAQPAPTPFVWTNLDADVINTGVELGINYYPIDNGDFRWNINANAAYNNNTVKNLGGLVINTGAINGQGLTGAFVQRIAEDQPLYAFFLREFTGYAENGSVQTYEGGDVQKFVGASPLPKWTGGINNTFNYKGLSLNIFLSGQFGHYIYSNTGNAFFTAGSIGGGRNVTQEALDQSILVDPNGEDRTNAPDVSTRFLEKGDFVRLQNIRLGYDYTPKTDMISSITFFLSGQNLAVFTGYSGQDPEVNTNKQIDGVPSFGIDYTSYPRARVFTFGANVNF